MILPTGRLAGAIALTAPLWLVSPAAATLALGVLAVASLVDLFMMPTPAMLTVYRTAPSTAGLGDETVLAYTMRSSARFPLMVGLTQALPAEIESGEAGFVVFGRLERNASMTTSATVRPMARGGWSLGDVTLHARAMLGLLRVQRRIPLDQPLLVIPSLAGIRRFRLLASHQRLRTLGVRTLRTRGAGRALAGLRAYTPGDDPRHVDWKATARHGHLVTREFAVERSQPVLLMVDCGRSMTQMAGDLPRFEHVLSAALLVAEVAANGGDQVGLLAFDHRVRAHVPPQRMAVDAVRRGVSGLAASMVEPDYALAFRTLALRQQRRALVIFFTDVLDVGSSRALVSLAARAARRHALIVITIRNEQLMAAARPVDSSAAALYVSAAAEELVHEREAALEQMRRAGATVLDVSTSGLAVAAVNRYLAIKARGAV